MDASNDALACLRLRGLPFQVTTAQIVEFFAPDYQVVDVLLTRSEGKPNGQAFVLLPKAEAAQAQAELNNRYLGKRFIEIFASTVADMDTARRMCAEQQKATAGSASGATNGANGSSSSSGSQRNKQSPSNLHIIRLRGLPFSATPADIKAFLAPIELPDGINSIQMVRHPDLRPTGEAYVHLNTETEVMQALNKHKELMGKRYIEVFPSCLAELQQSLTPARPMGYQADQGYMQAPNGMAAADLMHIPMLGGQGPPANNPAAQAAWLARQQQLVQAQQKMQLQAAAQQKMLSSLQQRQQQQAASLRMHAQLQAQAQALPNMFTQMQLSDVGSGTQQDTMVGAQGIMPGQSPVQQQQMLIMNGWNPPVVSMSPGQVAINSGSMGLSLAGAGAGGVTSSSNNMANSMSGLHASYGLMGGPTPGGLAHTAAAAATAICSPSPLDVQYVPFFCSANSAPMAAALMLQDSMGLQPSSLQMFSPSCTPFGKPLSASNAQQQQQPLFAAAEVLSSSGNATDVVGGGLSAAGGVVAPAAFCSDPLMGPLAGLGPNRF